jgi:hypothetical protein
MYLFCTIFCCSLAFPKPCLADIYVIRERDKNARLIRIAPLLPSSASSSASASAHDPFALHLQPDFIPLDTTVSPSAPVHLFPIVPHSSSSSSSSSALVSASSSKASAALGFSVLASATDSEALAEAEAAFFRARRESASSSAEYRMQHSSSSSSSSLNPSGGKPSTGGFVKHPSRVVPSEASRSDFSSSSASAAASANEKAEAEEDGETVDEWTRRRTGEWNVMVRQRPSDAALWLRFVAFQVRKLAGCGSEIEG